MILAITTPGRPADYREVEVLDDLSARAEVARFMAERTTAARGHAMAFIRAHRAGQPYRAETGHTFTLTDPTGDPT